MLALLISLVVHKLEIYNIDSFIVLVTGVILILDLP